MLLVCVVACTVAGVSATSKNVEKKDVSVPEPIIIDTIQADMPFLSDSTASKPLCKAFPAFIPDKAVKCIVKSADNDFNDELVDLLDDIVPL